MATLITQLNQTIGNYQDVFIYTINASFNGIQDTIDDASIKVLFPFDLNIYLGDVQDPIKNVAQEKLETGTLYTFQLGSISDLGIAIRLGIGVMFGPSAANETTIIITPELWINNSLYASYASDPIQLLVKPNFKITHEQMNPPIDPAPNSMVYYRVLLKNYGDLGGEIYNIKINCSSEDGFLIDSSYPVIGKDISSNGFSDTSQDQKMGAISENTLLFTIDSFYGEAYEFIYRVFINDDIAIGTEATSLINWSINELTQPSVESNTLISSPVFKTNFSLYGPEYSLPGRPINYATNFSNAGNQSLTDLSLTITLPQDVTFTAFTTGTYKLYGLDEILDLEYRITYTTNSGATGTVGIYNTNSNSRILFDDFLDSNDIIISLTWNFSTFPIGFVTNSTPLFDGTIKNSLSIGSMLLCQLGISYFANNTSSSNEISRVTMIQDICLLNPTFSSSLGNNPVRPGEVFQYTIGVNCRRSRLYAPTFSFLLPKEVEYIGEIDSSFYDYFQLQSEIAIPEPTVIKNYNEQDDTLLLFSFNDDFQIELPQKARLKVTFSAKVLSTSSGSFSSYFFLNSPSSSEEAKSSVFTNDILFFVSISSKKEAKGILDDDFVTSNQLATTLPGEEVFYRITLTNTGNATLDSVEFIDILPYPNDYGVIETDIKRSSEFPVILTSEVHARINTDLDLEIFYSGSKNPIRFGNRFNMIGTTDDWTKIPPEQLDTTHSIKIITQDSPLLPGESIYIIFKALVPFGVNPGSVAWNSFAADVTYTDTEGILQHLLAIEPDKVGVSIASADPTKGSISGFVFWDEYKNGMYSSISQRTPITNDIGVVLYNKQGIPLRATFTSNTLNGIPGQYSFSNLDLDTYYIRFFIDTTLHDFSSTTSLLANINKADFYGITKGVDLTSTPQADNIIAGIRSNKERYINTILKINQSSNQMIRNVIYDQMLIGMKMEDIL